MKKEPSWLLCYIQRSTPSGAQGWLPVLDACFGQRSRDDLLGLLLDEVEVRVALEALHIDLVDGLGAGGARREPAVLGDNLETTDGGIVARRLGQLGDDGLTRQGGGFYQCRIQLESTAFWALLAGASIRR